MDCLSRLCPCFYCDSLPENLATNSDTADKTSTIALTTLTQNTNEIPTTSQPSMERALTSSIKKPNSKETLSKTSISWEDLSDIPQDWVVVDPENFTEKTTTNPLNRNEDKKKY